MKTLVAIVAALLLGGPLAGLICIAVFISPALLSCESGSLLIGQVPDSLTSTTRDGRSIALDKSQLTHAATIISTASQTPGVGQSGALVALMAALTESRLRMLANVTAYPESAGLPHDGDGSDHDSLGLFQMRPATGWGTVADLMDASYQSRAFFGGPTGPNSGSPRGLLDIPGWQLLDLGQAAQAVEVSAFPDRYQNYRPVAEAIFDTLTAQSSGADHATPTVPETARIVFPLPKGTYTYADGFGWRVDPFTGARSFHAGSDLAAAAGAPILAIADGVVTFAGDRGTYGGLIIIEHTIGGEPVASYYAHMYDDGIHVAVGDSVAAGQHLGDVGSAGKATGPHLHVEIHPGGEHQPAVNAAAWLAAHDAIGLVKNDVEPAGCSSSSTGGAT